MNVPSRSHDHQTVLVGVDGSAASAAAVRWAAADAARRRARLHAVHVVERRRPGEISTGRDTRLELEHARRTVPGRVAEWVFVEGIDVDIAVSVLTGDVASQLAREAGDATLVVLGVPGALQHSALPVDLASRCPCPVVTVGALGDVTVVDVTAPIPEGASHAGT